MKGFVILLADFFAGTLVHSAYAGINAWTVTGPEGGTVSAVLYLPGKSGTLLAAAGQKILRSTDNGVTWSAPVLTFANPGTYVFACNPRNPNHIVIAGDSQGIYISDDAGSTFKLIGQYPPNTISGTYSLSYSADGQALYAGVLSNKILRSTDDGLTWSAPQGDMPANISTIDVAVSPTNQNSVFVAANGNAFGAYQSVNGGTSLTLRLNAQVQSAAIDPTDANAIVTGGFSGLYASKDGGATFPYYAYENAAIVRFDPVVAHRVFAISNAGRVRRSLDGGQTWSIVADLKTLDARSLSFDTTVAGRMVFGSSEGVLVSEDAGASWQTRNTGLRAGSFSQFRVHQGTQSIFVGGYGPVGVFKRATDDSWSGLGISSMIAIPPVVQIPGLDFPDGGVFALAVATSNPSIIYASRSRGILKSVDGGTTWSKPSTALDVDSVSGIAVDPTDPQIVYVGTPHGVMYSNNGGASWISRSTGIPSVEVCCLEIDPKNPLTIYGRSIVDGLFKTTDGGVSWSKLSLPASNQSYFKLAIDPANSNTLYLIFSSAGFWRSDDGGATWTRKLPSLLFFSDITFDASIPNSVYLVMNGSTISVSRSLDRGETFETIATPPTFSTNSLAVDPKKPANLLLSIYQSGILQYEIANDLAVTTGSVLTASNSLQSANIQLTNKGTVASINAKLTADAPAGVQSITAQADKGGICTVTGAHVECITSALKASDVMNVTLALNPSQAGGGQLTASSSAREIDPIATNNSATITVQPAPPASSGGGGGQIQGWWLVVMAWFAMRRTANARSTGQSQA